LLLPAGLSSFFMLAAIAFCERISALARREFRQAPEVRRKEWPGCSRRPEFGGEELAAGARLGRQGTIDAPPCGDSPLRRIGPARHPRPTAVSASPLRSVTGNRHRVGGGRPAPIGIARAFARVILAGARGSHI